MRILVVDHSRAERDGTVRLLDGHDVLQAQDAHSALAVLDANQVDVILVEATLSGGSSGADLVKRIRARESNTHVYTIMSSARAVDVRTAFLVGADDFIKKPLSKEELLARIDGPTRIMRWVSRVVATAEFAKVIGEGGGASELKNLSAWSSVDTSVSSEISDMLGMSLTSKPTANTLDGASTISSLTLSLVTENAEISFAVGVDPATSSALAESVLGDQNADLSAIQDMIREITNVAAGTFKRLAAAEGRSFTTGLPSETSPELFRDARAKDRRQWLSVSDDASISLRFEVEIRIRETKRVSMSDVREGMVIASDLMNDAGGLLMRAGTRVTESHIATMRRVLGECVSLEVAEAA